MLWLNRHARTRARLSQYIDATLSPPETAALEAHLATCDACRRELDDLRSTVSAVRDLPQVETPRSFLLTPQMLERRSAAPTPPAPRLAVGMRMASAAVAVVLAVVVIGDLSNGDGNGAGRDGPSLDSAAESRNAMEFDTGADAEEGGGEAEAPAATGLGDQDDTSAADEFAPTPAAPVEPLSSSCPTSGDQAAAGAGPTTAATPAATGAPTAVCEEKSMAGEEVQAATADAQEASAPVAQDEEGIPTLRVLEIVLAGTLIALLAAVAVEFESRRRGVA